MFLRLLASPLLIALLASTANAQVPFTVQTYGPSCGPIATGEVTPIGATYRFAFTVAQAAPQNHVLVILGVSQISVPIQFGHSCFLLTELCFTQLHRTDATGSYTWSHAMPGGFQGSACVQFAEVGFDPLGNLLIRTSGGVHLEYTG